MPIKRVVDYNVRVRVKPDNSGVDIANVKMSMNPFDEIAVEEAVSMKEKGVAETVTLISIGEKKSEEVLRTGIAMGADNAILVEANEEVQPLAVAKILKAVVDDKNPDLVILGKQAIDDDCNQTGQMLAALLGWGQATFASDIKISGGEATVVREVDGGLATIKTKLPCIITTDLRLNEPRYVALPNIMKARSKPIENITPDSLGVDVTSKIKTLKVEAPSKRQAGVKVGSVDELLDKLKNEAKVL